MGHYIRVFTRSAARIPPSKVKALLAAHDGVTVRFDPPRGAWSQALVTAGAEPVLTVERNAVARKSLGAQEVAEFKEELETAKPKSGAAWVRSWIQRVKTIYAVKLYPAATGHAKVVGAMVEGLRRLSSGIVQADFNGFSNENGDLVVWQFSEHAQGEWTVAVLDKKKKWVTYQLELSDERARAAFLAGKAPARR